MRNLRWGWLLFAVVAVGCAAGAPPLDELPLRDTLRADPEVVSDLAQDARARLAARFQTAGARDTTSDPVETGASSPALVVAQIDVSRQHRSADALVAGLVGGGAAQAVALGSDSRSGTLPPLEGMAATTTAAMETRALEGPAGASLRELVATSRAWRMERVTGWPVAAIAVGDTVYVNGAWLVAMAPADADAGTADGGSCDAGGCDAGTGGAVDLTGMRPGGANGALGGRSGRGGAGGASPPSSGLSESTWIPPSFDGGVVVYGPTTSSGGTDPGSSTLDDTAALADGCAAASDGCDSTSDSGDDSCSNQDDSSDSCSNSGDDADATNCQTAPGRHPTRPATVAWMMAPLVYLWGRKR